MMYEMTQMDAEKRGRAKGRAEGRKEGRAEGRAEGRVEGLTLMAKLIGFLLKDGRSDEIARVSSDEAFREEKLKEYGLK